MNSINKYVGKKIKEFRNKKKMSQTEVGKVLGVKQNTITGYEKGDWEVSYDNLFKLADLFDVSIDDFFPPTRTTYKPLHESTLITDDDSLNELDYEDMLLIKKITEKALELEGEERKRLMNNIKFAVDFFEKSDE